MTTPITVQDLMYASADRADMLIDVAGVLTISSFIDPVMHVGYINAELTGLWDILIGSHEDYAIQRDFIQLQANVDNYPLPRDMYKFRKIFPMIGGRRGPAMRRFKLANLGNEELAVSSVDFRDLQYRIVGWRIWFDPVPAADGEAEFWYAPVFNALTNERDVIPFQFPIGWADYVSEGAASRLLEKEESDAAPTLARQQRILQRILQTVEDRDIGEPHQMLDTQGYEDYGDYWR